ncbi:MAG: barstar family protein [Planctomycetota bacterium]
MVIFKEDSEDWKRLDFDTLKRGPIALYHSASLLTRDVEEMRSLGYLVLPMDLESEDEESFHTLVARVLKFPGYYGRNLDALNDCLGGLPETFGEDLLIVLDSFDTFFRRDERSAHIILDLLWQNSMRNQLWGHTTITFVRSADPRFEVPPVGAAGVGWNSEEFLNSSRGV